MLHPFPKNYMLIHESLSIGIFVQVPHHQFKNKKKGLSPPFTLAPTFKIISYTHDSVPLTFH